MDTGVVGDRAEAKGEIEARGGGDIVPYPFSVCPFRGFSITEFSRWILAPGSQPVGMQNPLFLRKPFFLLFVREKK